MRQLLVTLLAVIMSVSMASAATTAKETANKKVAEVMKEAKDNKEEAIKSLSKQLSNDGVLKSEKALEGIKKVFSKTEDQINALALFSAAKEGSKEEKELSAQLNYSLVLLANGKISAETLNPHLNAAKTLLESDGVEADSVKKLTNQIKRLTATTYLAKKNGINMSEADIDLLSFVNEVYQGADKKASINDVKEVTAEMKKAYEEWKNNCKG